MGTDESRREGRTARERVLGRFMCSYTSQREPVYFRESPFGLHSAKGDAIYTPPNHDIGVLPVLSSAIDTAEKTPEPTKGNDVAPLAAG